MEAGICLARPDRSRILPGQTILIGNVGRVSYAAYADYTDLYDVKKPGDRAMCTLALHYLQTQPTGDHAKIARALWTPAVSASCPECEQETWLRVAKIIFFSVIAYLAFRAYRKVE
jgi:hypothetical protein